MEIEPIQEEPMAVESREGNLQGQLSIEFRDKAALYQAQPSKNVQVSLTYIQTPNYLNRNVIFLASDQPNHLLLPLQSGMDSPLITALRSREPTADLDSEQFSYKELTKTVFTLDAPQTEQQELQSIPAATALPPLAIAPTAAASAQPVAHHPASRSVSRSPTKRATSPTKKVSSPTKRNTHKASTAAMSVVLPDTSAATSEDEGLQFLLRACELLEPEEEEAAAALLINGLKQRGQSNQDLSDGGSRRYFKRPAAVGQNNNNRSSRRRNSSDVSDLEDDHDVMNSYLAKSNTTKLTRSNSGSDGSSQGDDDEDYRPSNSRRPARKAASGARAVIQAAAAAAADVSPTGYRDQDRYPYAPAVKGAPSRPSTGRNAAGSGGGGDSHHRVANPTGGPCMNPDCEHPYDSPQWRKGPPQAPVLCNACGTRFLRNGTLKPICPKRGIRYGKDGKPTRMVSSSGGSSASTSPMKQGAGARGGLGSGLGGRVAAAVTAGSVLESSGVAALMAAAEQQQQQQQPQAILSALASSNPAIAAAMQYEQFLSSWVSMQQQAQQEAQQVQQQQVQQQQPMELKMNLSMGTDTSLGEKSESEGGSGRLRPVFSLTAVAGPANIAAPAPLNISIAAPAVIGRPQQQDAMEIDGQ